jgi:hypothetical protein
LTAVTAAATAVIVCQIGFVLLRKHLADNAGSVLKKPPGRRLYHGHLCLQVFKGMAMWWFNKGKRKQIWDEEIQWPIGDIEAAHKIRDICRSADGSAERVAGFAGRPDNKTYKYETERYERAAKAAMEIAIKISDDLLRDSSVRQIVDLCMKANDLKTARILFRAIGAVSIKQDVLVDHPALRH